MLALQDFYKVAKEKRQNELILGRSLGANRMKAKKDWKRELGHNRRSLPVLGCGKWSSLDLDRPLNGKNLRDLVDLIDLVSGSETEGTAQCNVHRETPHRWTCKLLVLVKATCYFPWNEMKPKRCGMMRTQNQLTVVWKLFSQTFVRVPKTSPETDLNWEKLSRWSRRLEIWHCSAGITFKVRMTIREKDGKRTREQNYLC